MSALRSEITCVNCWTRFPPEDVLWIAEHQDLEGDSVVEGRLRFLPSRFNLRGNALDLYGVECRELACPTCHLSVPRPILEREPIFVSLLGTPTSGKSYFLAALAASARRDLPGKLAIDFTDADSTANMPIIAYEEQLFHAHRPDELVPLAKLIEKTQRSGSLYRPVIIGGQSVSLPTPFTFLLKPKEGHANYGKMSGKVVCLYDNAGENFLPGGDSVSNPETRHMSEASFLLFLFDPTQDPRWHEMMRRSCPTTEMPVVQGRRQEDVLREALTRVRKLRGLPDGVKHDRPLIVVLNKSDLWRELIPKHENKMFVRQNGIAGVNTDAVTEQSNALRALLMHAIPEVVYAAEGFCERVYYMAASPLGNRPEYVGGQPHIRPRDIRPDGVLLPFLLGLQTATSGLLQYTSRTAPKNGVAMNWPHP
jgi:hypothetical protein